MAATKGTKATGRPAKQKSLVTEPEFVLKFEGRPNAISAPTLLESLYGITSVLQEASHELGAGETLDIKVKAPKPGSFLVHLVIDPAATALFVGLGLAAIQALSSSIQIWQFLRGERPASVEDKPGDKIELHNERGDILVEDRRIVNFVLVNSTVSFNLARTFGALDGDANVTGLAMLDAKKKDVLVRVPREDFAVMAVAPPPTHEQKRDITVRARLTIVKPSFDPKLRWDFVYNGNHIGAVVVDKTFNAAIDAGAKGFKKGDALDVSLRMRQEYDSTLKVFLNKAYEVVTVHAHILGGAEQSDLFAKR